MQRTIRNVLETYVNLFRPSIQSLMWLGIRDQISELIIHNSSSFNHFKLFQMILNLWSGINKCTVRLMLQYVDILATRGRYGFCSDFHWIPLGVTLFLFVLMEVMGGMMLLNTRKAASCHRHHYHKHRQIQLKRIWRNCQRYPKVEKKVTLAISGGVNGMLIMWDTVFYLKGTTSEDT